MKRLRWVAVLGLVAATFAACGDDGGDDEADAGAAPSGATSEDDERDESDGEPVDEADAQADVDAAVGAFVAELEAAGFTPDPSEDDEEEFEFTSEECKAFDDALPDEDNDLPGQTAEAEAGSYQRSSDDPLEGAAFVEGAAAVVSDGDAIDEVFELLADDRFPTCIREAMQQGIDESAAEDPSAPAPEVTIDVQRGDTPPGVDNGVSLLIAGSMGVSGLSFDVDGVIEIVRRDDRVAMFLAMSVGKPHDLDVAGLVGTLLGEEAA